MHFATAISYFRRMSASLRVSYARMTSTEAGGFAFMPEHEILLSRKDHLLDRLRNTRAR
jgi:hypothetical protein